MEYSRSRVVTRRHTQLSLNFLRCSVGARIDHIAVQLKIRIPAATLNKQATGILMNRNEEQSMELWLHLWMWSFSYPRKPHTIPFTTEQADDC
jgi:hypothetical protein